MPKEPIVTTKQAKVNNGDMKYITYCGLYCRLCATAGRIPRQAQALRDTMAKEGYEFFGHEIVGFTDFWGYLTRLSKQDQTCLGCRGGCGNPTCKIRQCARQREVEICPVDCQDYPCPAVRELAGVYPTLLADGARLKEVGVARWVAEQQQRAATGFAYADIRCPGGPDTTDEHQA